MASKLEKLSLKLEELLITNNCVIKPKGPNLILVDKDTGEEVCF